MLRLQPRERAIEARLSPDAVTAEAAAALCQLRGEKHFAAEVQSRDGVANERLAVPVCGGRIDDRSAHLLHSLDFGADGVTVTVTELVGAQAHRRQLLARGRNRLHDQR